MESATATLPRTERLRTLGAIRRLFTSGEAGFVYPFRYIWFAEADDQASAEVLFSVPKKFHKRAVQRNLLRRRAKEAYRLQKRFLLNPSKTVSIDIAFIYTSKEVASYETIYRSIGRIIQQITEHL
jgi:ribonuclease P protein component